MHIGNNTFPIRVLHISTLHLGGIQSHIIEIQKNINRNKVQFDFLCFSNIKNEFYDETVYDLGGRKHWYTPQIDNLLAQALYLFFIIIKNKYKIVDIPVSRPDNILFVIIAKLCGAKTFVHAHSDQTQGGTVNNIDPKAKLLYLLSNYQFACSKGAACYCFGSQNADKIMIEKNGINLKQFAFSELKRTDYRKNFNLENTLLLGQIGRLEHPKNPEFSIQVVSELVKRGKKINLFFVGTGSKEQELKNLAIHLNVQDNVFFLGERRDIPELLCAMDVLLMPSFYEGFPVVAVEAQAAELPIVLSANISRSVKITENMHFFDLKDIEKWVEFLYSFVPIKRKSDITLLRNNGYDIVEVAKKIEEIYLTSIGLK